jgi:uncharacterized membrane protein YphA (DoxX/SURF4 family)
MVLGLMRRADNLTTLGVTIATNLVASASWKLQGLSRSVQGLNYLYLIIVIMETRC